ncbi:hypothetical protein EJV46_09545 [Roseococcus sp. SYP-B2431]|uniref:hypothetical protein n=1 Tax=Roseococcus sp. SYP-B2431 TaxID=2496640 RepID=UPI00103D1992|nr:hypothetical protein [Roseococcus sp. SYP-B2431]TCH98800.1 hypothetical protein EJV46_09545 [Roseococcus sp. SYP-B2431]
MANPFPVIAICIATVATSFGVAFLASASPNEDRACAAGELVAERFFAIEAPDGEGGRRASYFVELANPQGRPQVFNLAFDLAEAPDRRTGDRAMSLAARQSMPVMLGTQALDASARPISPEAMSLAIRVNCRAW